MSSAVLDASALIALFRREPGAEAVARVLDGALISSVNASEVYSKAYRWQVSLDEAVRRVATFPIRIAEFSNEEAVSAASLIPATQHLGLSLGDRACLALAHARSREVFTAEKAWAKLNLGVKIHVIR